MTRAPAEKPLSRQQHSLVAPGCLQLYRAVMDEDLVRLQELLRAVHK